MDKNFWKSKKFWVMIVSVVFGILKMTGVDVPSEMFAGPTAYLVGQGIADHGKESSERLVALATAKRTKR